MQVIAHQPQHWYLLLYANDYIFDLCVNIGFSSFTVTFFLNEQETNNYLSMGNTYLDNLAYQVEQSAYHKSSKFTDRFLHSQSLEKLVSEAIKYWQLSLIQSKYTVKKLKVD